MACKRGGFGAACRFAVPAVLLGVVALRPSVPRLTADGLQRAPASRPVADTVSLIDDEGGELRITSPPRRIVSLVPAATELLFALGAGGDLAGRTRFDNQPPEALRVPSVGDGVRPSVEVILSRRPDLVILFAGPDSRAASDALRRIGVPVLALRHNTLADLRLNIRRLGRITGRQGVADRLLEEIRDAMDRIRLATRDLPQRSVYYDAWWHPPITIGAGSYLDSLITLVGGRNVFGDLAAPSPQVSLEAIAARDPEIILYPVHEGSLERAPISDRPGWEVLSAVRQGRIRVFDGEVVVRLGPRVGDAAAALAAAIHPEAFGDGPAVGDGGVP